MSEVSVKIKRNYKSNSVVGDFEVSINNKHVLTLSSLELPWRNNLPNISCIPEGEYKCKPYSSAKYNNVYEVTGVMNRSYILIHIGNFTTDTRGCILVGLGAHCNPSMVEKSTRAMNALRAVIGDSSFTLNIE